MSPNCHLPYRLPILFIVLFLGLASTWAGTPELNGEDSIIDNAGRQITVATPFKRIISLYAAHTENLCMLGVENAIVGISKNSFDPPAATEKKRFSYRDDPEKFLSVKPDLVLIRPMIDRAYPSLISQLEKYGITVVSLQPSTVEEMYRYWKILGRLVGRELQAAHMVAGFINSIDSIRAMTGDIAPKKRVYFEAIHSKMKTFTPTAMAIFALTAAGGLNVAHEAESVRGTNIAFYGKERILSHAGQIDIYLAQKGPMNNPTVEQIRTEPGFSKIKAVEENHIFLIDEAIVSRPTPRMIQGICQIGAILYPEIFPGQLKESCQ